MTNLIRWGLLSTANINRRLIPAIRGTDRGQLAAVASRDMHKASAYAAEWQIPGVFGSYEEMLSSDAIDAVYVSLPNKLHAEWAIKALEAGKHVLCEKPFATTLEDVDRMIAASRQTGMVLAEAFMYRHHPQTRLVEEWVREGRLGEIILLRGAFSFYMQNRAGNVRLESELHGGALWDVGIYPVSFSQRIFGAIPETVTGQQLIGASGVDESFSGQMNYANGRSAQITCGFNVPLFTSFEIHGTQGRISLNRPFVGIQEDEREIIFTPAEGEPQKLKVRSSDPYQHEVEDIHAAILDGEPPLVTLEESRNHIRTALALYQAARSAQVVRLE
jgi:D-xylose 1-dehydrogenase (NADP+, D-xylono-1,5-lactone-forming)